MKRLAIIGGNSLIAKSFCRKFKDHLEIHSFSRTLGDHKGVNNYQVEWSSPSQEQITSLGEAEYILYCIGETNGSKRVLADINIKLLEDILIYLKPNQKFIFISSVAIELNESYYSYTKKEGERLVKEKFKEYLILRPSMLYGNGDRKNLKKIKDLIRFLPIIPILKPDILIQPVFVEDLTDVIYQAISNHYFPNKAYSIAGPNQVPTKEVIETICKKAGYKRFFLSLPIAIIQKTFRFLQFVSPIAIPLSYQIENLKSHPQIICNEAIEELSFNPKSFKEGYLSF